MAQYFFGTTLRRKAPEHRIPFDLEASCDLQDVGDLCNTAGRIPGDDGLDKGIEAGMRFEVLERVP